MEKLGEAQRAGGRKVERRLGYGEIGYSHYVLSLDKTKLYGVGILTVCKSVRVDSSSRMLALC